MLSKNEMNTTFMEIAPHFLSFLEGEKSKIEAEVARLKATEAKENSGTAEEPIPATAVAETGTPTEATDPNEKPTTKARRVGGLRRRN